MATKRLKRAASELSVDELVDKFEERQLYSVRDRSRISEELAGRAFEISGLWKMAHDRAKEIFDARADSLTEVREVAGQLLENLDKEDDYTAPDGRSLKAALTLCADVEKAVRKAILSKKEVDYEEALKAYRESLPEALKDKFSIEGDTVVEKEAGDVASAS